MKTLELKQMSSNCLFSEWTSGNEVKDYTPRDLLKADVYSFCSMVCWICVPELRSARLIDPIQQKTIIGIGEAANRFVNCPDLTPEELSWLDELKDSDISESEEDLGDTDPIWGDLKDKWQSLIRQGLNQNPHERLSMRQIFYNLRDMRNRYLASKKETSWEDIVSYC